MAARWFPLNSLSEMSRHWVVLAIAVSSLICTIGCGSGEITEASALASTESFNRGIESFESGNLAAAHSELDAALNGQGGLNADQYVEALLKRSMCLAQSGDFDAAQADLDEASQGVTEMDQLLVAEAFLFAKRGDQAGSDRKLAEAKRFNPKAALPAEN